MTAGILSVYFAKKENILVYPIGILSTAIYVYLLAQWQLYGDTFTTGAAFAAMWLMANKKLESWFMWIVVNISSVPLYFIKGFGFTGIQYTVFLVLAIQGHYEWKKRMKSP